MENVFPTPPPPPIENFKGFPNLTVCRGFLKQTLKTFFVMLLLSDSFLTNNAALEKFSVKYVKTYRASHIILDYLFKL